jgi:hypothetical protein
MTIRSPIFPKFVIEKGFIGGFFSAVQLRYTRAAHRTVFPQISSLADKLF